MSPRLGFPLAGKLMKVGAEFMFSCIEKIHRKHNTIRGRLSNARFQFICVVQQPPNQLESTSIQTSFTITLAKIPRTVAYASVSRKNRPSSCLF